MGLHQHESDARRSYPGHSAQRGPQTDMSSVLFGDSMVPIIE